MSVQCDMGPEADFIANRTKPSALTVAAILRAADSGLPPTAIHARIGCASVDRTR